MMLVPVVDVHNDNFTDLWPSLLLAVRSATFVALDAELSGLGNRKQLNTKSVEDRFKAVSHVAKTRSVVSLGLSCFKLTNHSSSTSPPDQSHPAESGETTNGKPCDLAFMVQTFNITVLCEEDYVVEPTALQFLVDHGFDFNKQYSKGIPYYKGEDQADKQVAGADIRALFTELITCKIPVAFHNAFIDLVFLYETFYAPLPPSLGMFVSDLSEIFEGGLFDTKYVSEFIAHFPASYLDYVFHKSQRENESERENGSSSVTVTFPSYPDKSDCVMYRECATVEKSANNPIRPDILKAMRPLICGVFAAHGWCPSGRLCTKSHDINLILDSEVASMKKKKNRRPHNRKRKHVGEGTENSEVTEKMETEDLENKSTNNTSETHTDSVIQLADNGPTEPPNGDTANTLPRDASEPTEVLQQTATCTEVKDIYSSRNRGHRAGFDAFMTGFAMSTFINKHGTRRNFSGDARVLSFAELGLESLVNRVFLSGKDMPLSITKSSFSKTSKQHNEKWKKIHSLA